MDDALLSPPSRPARIPLVLLQMGKQQAAPGLYRIQRLNRRRTGLGRRGDGCRSEEHTSELQSLMRISYAVFCLKKKKTKTKARQKQTKIECTQIQKPVKNRTMSSRETIHNQTR